MAKLDGVEATNVNVATQFSWLRPACKVNVRFYTAGFSKLDRYSNPQGGHLREMPSKQNIVRKLMKVEQLPEDFNFFPLPGVLAALDASVF